MPSIDRYLSRVLFAADFSKQRDLTKPAFQLTTAKEIGFQETWLQEAIEREPELVLQPCREAELVEPDEQWKCWGREIGVPDVGSIDVLLVSNSGRIAIVETKLAYNPEKRRAVVAQVLDYAIHFSFDCVAELAPPKESDGSSFVDVEDIQDRCQQRDYLLVIAGDRLDSKAVKLSEALLGKHLVHPWDMALVEVAVFEQCSTAERKQHLLVPYLRGALIAEQRQVVRVTVAGDRTRVDVQQTAPVSIARRKWTEAEFFQAAHQATDELQTFAAALQRLRTEHPAVTFDFGTAKDGSLVFKYNENSILEFYLAGFIRFRPLNADGQVYFDMAFGHDLGNQYKSGLEQLFPRAARMAYPLAHFAKDHAGRVLSLLEEILNAADAHQQSMTRGTSASS